MKNWTKKTQTNNLLRSSAPIAPFNNLTKEARIAAMKAAIKEVVDAKLNKENN
jgi:hypothetical protein